MEPDTGIGARGLFIEALWVTHRLTHLWATIQSLITTCFCGCGATDLAMAGCGGTIRAWDYSSITTPREILDVNVFLISYVCGVWALLSAHWSVSCRAKMQKCNLTFGVSVPHKRWNSNPTIYFQELIIWRLLFLIFVAVQTKTKIVNAVCFCPSSVVNWWQM